WAVHDRVVGGARLLRRGRAHSRPYAAAAPVPSGGRRAHVVRHVPAELRRSGAGCAPRRRDLGPDARTRARVRAARALRARDGGHRCPHVAQPRAQVRPVAGESKTAVIAAIVGNLAIAVSKFAAAGFSGSAAMLSEAIHSLVDTGNDALMLYGIRRSAKPPDHDHPFGYGHELYFWTLVVGVLIFAVGGGMSIVSGVLHIVNRKAAEADVWNYAVLGVAAVFEAISWYFGLRAFRKEQAGRGVIETIKVSKDPTTFSVLLEDSERTGGRSLDSGALRTSAL